MLLATVVTAAPLGGPCAGFESHLDPASRERIDAAREALEKGSTRTIELHVVAAREFDPLPSLMLVHNIASARDLTCGKGIDLYDYGDQGVAVTSRDARDRGVVRLVLVNRSGKLMVLPSSERLNFKTAGLGSCRFTTATLAERMKTFAAECLPVDERAFQRGVCASVATFKSRAP